MEKTKLIMKKRVTRAMAKKAVAKVKANRTSALDVQHGGDHYKKMAIQPAVFCHANHLEGAESAAIAYIARHRFKNGADDIEKAIHTLQMLLEMEYGE